MLSYLLERFSTWEHLGTRQSETGTRLIAHTPRDFPQAYLHKYFAPLPTSAWDSYPLLLPRQLQELYAACNGLSIFGSLSLWGIRAHYARDSSAQFQPFDLATHHGEWARASELRGYAPEESTIFFGSYSWDGSGVYVVGDEPEVHRSSKGSTVPLNTWPSLSSFITTEYDRLDGLFSREGYELDERFPKVPRDAP